MADKQKPAKYVMEQTAKLGAIMYSDRERFEGQTVNYCCSMLADDIGKRPSREMVIRVAGELDIKLDHARRAPEQDYFTEMERRITAAEGRLKKIAKTVENLDTRQVHQCKESEEADDHIRLKFDEIASAHKRIYRHLTGVESRLETLETGYKTLRGNWNWHHATAEPAANGDAEGGE